MKTLGKNIAVLGIALAMTACGGSSNSSDSDADSAGGEADTSTDTSTDTGADSTTPADDGGGSEVPVDTSTDGSSSDDSSGDDEPVDTSDDDASGSTGGAGTGTGGGNVTLFGSVDVDISDEIDISAGFASFNLSISPSVIEAGFRDELDTCDFTVIGDDFNESLSPLANPPEGFSFEAISAGEVITISSSAGSYAEISRTTEFGYIFYGLDENVTLSQPVPSNLVVDIPGDEFPAFSNIPLPGTVPLVVSSPAMGAPIQPTTVFSWTPSGEENSYIEISATGFSPDATGFKILNCLVADDGSFEFSADTKAAMGDVFSAFGSMSRVANTFHQNGSAILVVTGTAERVQ